MEPLSIGRPLLSWRAPEHIHIRPNPRGLVISTVLLALIIAYAIFTNSPLMAITFILIGIVGYIFITRDPREFEFTLTDRGILGGNTLYEFDDLRSFWIYEDPPLSRVLSLHSNGIISPFVHIPLGDVNENELRALLLEFVPEEKHHPTIIDTLEKMLHI